MNFRDAGDLIQSPRRRIPKTVIIKTASQLEWVTDGAVEHPPIETASVSSMAVPVGAEVFL